MAEDSSEQNKDYGLPKVDPQPIDRGQPGIASESKNTAPDPGKKDNRLIIIVLSVIGVLVLASLLYIVFWNSDGEPEQGGVSSVEDRAVLDPEENEETGDISGDEDDGEINNTVVSEEPGSIVTISERTNRYYIFVGSYKFRAYAHRHAEKLAADGFAVKLIIPDNWVGMRVAIGNYSSIEEANVDAQQIRSRYGNEVVISKY